MEVMKYCSRDPNLQSPILQRIDCKLNKELKLHKILYSDGKKTILKDRERDSASILHNANVD